MEDMARLALVEQNIKDVHKFSEILHELLYLINHILDNPHDKELRTIKSEILKNLLGCQALNEYLKYIGFESVHNGYEFPKEQALSKLRIAQAALERKISFCCGSLNNNVLAGRSSSVLSTKRPLLNPSNILATANPFLKKIESLFNGMIKYEDKELQKTAREHIPLVTLQLMALDRMREQQKKIKTGELKGRDMTFDIALLMELLGWFKHKFFSWVDQLACEACGGRTKFQQTATMKTETETCRVELYTCTECGQGCRFPRYNDARTLLRTRRGRCGEWANCFTLLCRALGYDTRYVYDTTDHVWCEVFDYDSNSWLHADPCEGKLNAPLMYTHGWGKRLSYVFAFSRDDLQDVTWRYTTDHKEVLARRSSVAESELVAAILGLRAHRQAQASAARRTYLAARTLRELVDLMLERKPSDYESHGRISGSKEWRTERGEIGSDKKHTFEFSSPGDVDIRYYTSSDKYRISCGGIELEPINGWTNGVFEKKNVFRKVEEDWRQVYLAREEGEATGSVSWKLAISGDTLTFNILSVRATTAIYENGHIDWTIQFDNELPAPVEFGDAEVTFERQFSCARLAARLSGGAGDVRWQHAQLFRQPLDACAGALHIRARVVTR